MRLYKNINFNMKPIIKKYALLLITASIFTSVASVAKGQSYNNQQAAPVYYDYRKVNFQDGSSYEGGMVNDEKQGFGVYYYSDGRKYEGAYHMDKCNGIGILYDKNGSVQLSGKFISNQLVESFSVNKNTIYTINYPNKGQYIGTLASGKRNGYGTYKFPIQNEKKIQLEHMGIKYNHTEAYLEGNWLDNLASGNMTMKVTMHNFSESIIDDEEDDDYLEWQLNHDKTITVLTGNFVANYFEGYGSKEVYIIFGKDNEYKGISKYIGYLKFSQPHGKGKKYDWLNGSWQLQNDGEFKDGNYVGPSY
jgi:hypothetical protein